MRFNIENGFMNLKEALSENHISAIVKEAQSTDICTLDWAVAVAIGKVLYQVFRNMGSPTVVQLRDDLNANLPGILDKVKQELRVRLDEALEKVSPKNVMPNLEDWMESVIKYFEPAPMERISTPQGASCNMWKCRGRSFLIKKGKTGTVVEATTWCKIEEIYVDGKQVPFTEIAPPWSVISASSVTSWMSSSIATPEARV